VLNACVSLCRPAVLLAAVVAAGSIASAQPPAERLPSAALSAPASKAAPAPVPRPTEEKAAATRHTIRIGGQTVAYTATAGTQFLRDEAGTPIASMFYVYYARDGVTDLSRRPIVYSFNGGPGTASIWMHLGFTGPRRPVYDEDGFMLQPPFRLHDNEHSILDIADIVYIDPIGTGYSRMMPGEDLHRFHGVSDDIAAMGEFIRVFTERQGRWGSPKFLIGESYGTTRASGLVGHMQSAHQMYFNGVILVSMTALQYERGADLSYVTVLPYMTATAWYHKKLPADLQAKPLEAVLAESERYASNEYQVALFKGGFLGADERAAAAKQVARLTGLPADFVLQSNLRIEKSRFWKELLRDRGLTVGRLDSRYTGVDRDASGEAPEGDPAMWAWDGPFAGAIHQYFRDELNWKTDDKYFVWGNVRPWRQDPEARVGKYTISHLDPGGTLMKRFTFAFYESGHMMYLKNSALAKAKQDLAAFIGATSAK
jgi:carboxypeptidase C (cathepsin A)